MALDYALLKSVSRGGAPVLRLYRWERPTVTIGYFQMIRDEVFIEACERDGVPVIRRITGGGAVYHDAELTYSVSIPLDSPKLQGTILDSYERICSPVTLALRDVGINAKFAPINDILADGRKISGNAQTRRNGVLLQHGTILLDLAADSMFSYLNVHEMKGAGKGTASPGTGVTSVKSLIGERALSDDFINELMDSIAYYFADEFEAVLTSYEFTEQEFNESDIIRKEFFNNQAWNFKR